MTELYLPRPPSANRLWGYGRGRVFKTAEYRAWIEHAGHVLNTQHPGLLSGRYKLFIQMRDGSSGIDLDNCFKPTSDLLQRMGVIENDKLARMVSACWVSSGFDGLYVRVEPAGVE
jgi:Holliday junction resolvase RusA-like endonuclease